MLKPSLVAPFPWKPGCCASLDVARSKKQTNRLSSQGSGAHCLQLLPKQTMVLFLSKPEMKSAPTLSHPHADASTPAPDAGAHPQKPISSFAAAPQHFPPPLSPTDTPQSSSGAAPTPAAGRQCPPPRGGTSSPGRSAAARMQTPIVHQDARQLVCSCEAMRVP